VSGEVPVSPKRSREREREGEKSGIPIGPVAVKAEC